MENEIIQYLSKINNIVYKNNLYTIRLYDKNKRDNSDKIINHLMQKKGVRL